MEVNGNKAVSVSVSDGIASTVTIHLDENGEPQVSCAVLFVEEFTLKKTLQPRVSDG